MTDPTARTATGEFTKEIEGLESGKKYEFRAIVKHPLLMMNSKAETLTVPATR